MNMDDTQAGSVEPSAEGAVARATGWGSSLVAFAELVKQSLAAMGASQAPSFGVGPIDNDPWEDEAAPAKAPRSP